MWADQAFLENPLAEPRVMQPRFRVFTSDRLPITKLRISTEVGKYGIGCETTHDLTSR